MDLLSTSARNRCVHSVIFTRVPCRRCTRVHSSTSEIISGGEFTAIWCCKYRYRAVYLVRGVAVVVIAFIVMDNPQSEVSVSTFSILSSPSPAIVPD